MGLQTRPRLERFVFLNRRLLAQRGEPIRDLQALAGHATAAFTLQRYTHHYDSSARRTADAMGNILPDEP